MPLLNFMKTLIKSLTLVSILTVVGAAPSPAQNLIANGNFTANAAAFVGNNGILGAPNPLTITSWTDGTGNMGINGPATGVGTPYGPATPGAYNFSFIQWGSAASSLSQTLTSAYTPNTRYELSFDAAGFYWGPSTAFRVSLGDNTQVHFTTQVGTVDLNSTALTSFTHFSYTFTSPATFYGPCVIKLLNLDTAGHAIDFANVSLVVAPQPPTGNLIANSNFTANAGSFTGNNGSLGAPNPTAITSWTAGAGNVGINGPATSVGTPFGPATPGTYNFSFIQWGSAASSLSQTLAGTYTPNTRYELSFDAAGFHWSPSTVFRVQIGDNTQVHFTTQVGTVDLNSTALTSFTHFSYMFTSPTTFDGPCVIRLLNLDQGNTAIDFANVSLVMTVPPPPTISNSGPICAGSTLSLAAFTPYSPTAWAWTGPSGFTSALQNPTISSASTLATGTYSCTVKVSGVATTSPAATTVVTVGDTKPPTITCPADVTVSANSGCTATNVVLGSPVTGDNCGVASVVSNARAAYPLGTNSVIWTVTDGSGNTATCTQQVIVRDTAPPTIISYPADVIINL